jgi:hypothetical protein
MKERRFSHLRRIFIASTLAGLTGIGSIAVLRQMGLFRFGKSAARQFSYEELTGSVFLPPPRNPGRPPQTRELAVPSFPDATSVWGATGRDPRGHIWVGVSASSPGMSAHLMEYDPNADAWRDHGAVVEQLKATGIIRPGEGQIKIHSKIVPAADGWLYFASTDEQGESDTTLPRWGSHLWRIHPERQRWEHLMAVPEGLVAVNGVGRNIFALGYWGHVLYRYDTLTGSTARTVVGSVPGHVSRNFLADAGGHAFVPRVAARADGSLFAQLVEYDSALLEIAVTPLEFYLRKGSPADNHGIVGLAFLQDGSLLFTTHSGQLYRVELQSRTPGRVTRLGWFHPEGEAYAPSLFALGGSLISGVTQRSGRYEWVVFELNTRVSAASPLDTKNLDKLLLYGSISRDDVGRFYVGGWASASGGPGNQRPVVLQLLLLA